MKKLLVSLVLVFVLFFNFGNVNAQITKKQKIQISNFLNNYFEKLNIGRNNFEILKKLEKISNNIEKLKKIKPQYKDILEFINKKIIEEIIYKGNIIISPYYENISKEKVCYDGEGKKCKIKQNLEKAYVMKYKPKISLENFKKLYKTERKNIYVPRNIKYLGNSTFKFRVDLYDGKISDKGESFKEAYKVVMKIISSKLETLSSKKINLEILEEKNFGNNKAVIKWENGDTKLYLDGKIIEKIDKVKNNFYGFSSSLRGLKFINNGNILVFEKSGWEWSSKNLYNIKTGKILELDGIFVYGVTKDKKYIYTCGESGMSGGGVKIYKNSDFSLYKNLGENKGVYKCIGYDKNKNIFKYELSSWNKKLQKEEIFKREYNFYTGKVK